MIFGTYTPRQTADLCTGILLLAFSIAMAAYSLLTMPLLGTYAGVSNAWFVSPALLPVAIALLLGLLSVILIFTTVKLAREKAENNSHEKPYPAYWPLTLMRENAALFAAASAIVVFVFGYLPRIDFVVTTVAFLLAVTVRFHLPHSRQGSLFLRGYVVGGLMLWIMALLGIQTGIRTAEAFILDAAIGVACFCAMLYAYFGSTAADNRSARHCVWVSLLFPIVLTVVFKFGLRVPMPREGLITNYMDQIFFALRNMF